jgi:hypothetical protein
MYTPRIYTRARHASMLLVLYSSVFFSLLFLFLEKACSKESFTQRTRFTSEMKRNKLHIVAHIISTRARHQRAAVRAALFERSLHPTNRLHAHNYTHTPRFCNSPIYDTTPLILSGFYSIQTKRVRNYQWQKL